MNDRPVPRHHRTPLGITNDPNRADDPHYILRLIAQVITVSLETNAIVASLPTLGLPEDTERREARTGPSASV